MHTYFALYKQFFFFKFGTVNFTRGGGTTYWEVRGGSQLLLNTNFSGSLTQDI